MTQKRPPIVVVLGHVDHGKTTLLDYLNRTNVQSREAGGITQKISAIKLSSKEGNFTFIDTPGHAAFSTMRQKGAKVADIALLVVAADDGPKPQTQEALDYIQKASLPFIVVITKTDLPSADVQKTLSELEKLGILFEGRGGNTPYVELSAKTGQGVDNLLEVLSLLSELTDIKADTENLKAFIIESNKDKMGPVAFAIVRDGKLNVGDNIKMEDLSTRVRGLFNELGKPIKEALPGDPVVILGFSQIPQAGSFIEAGDSNSKKTKSEIKKNKIPKIANDQVAIILKASTSGSLEAIKNIIPNEAVVVSSTIGEVNETDVFLAKSTNATIFSFETNIPSKVKLLAETEDVSFFKFNTIYELTQKIEELITNSKEKVIGKAQILAIFPFNNKKVAGCKVIEGTFKVGSIVKITRGETIVGGAKVSSLKREKQNIDIARAGEECGMLFSPELDFEVGDVILSADSK